MENYFRLEARTYKTDLTVSGHIRYIKYLCPKKLYF